jgi:hypothetical protein
MNNDKYDIPEEDLTELVNLREVEDDGPGVRGRGRPRIPEQWSKVLSIHNVDLLNLKAHLISTDLLLAEGYEERPMVPVPGDSAEPNWAPIFLHKHWLIENLNPTPDDYKLDPDELLERGQ